MKNLFLLLFSSLVIFSQVMIWKDQTGPGVANIPTIYWVTDANPARMEQVKIFKTWLEKRKLPPVHLKLDYNNQGLQKTIVQGVTGVAGDLIDASAMATQYYRSIGLLDTATNLESLFGYPDSQIYGAIRPDLFTPEGQIAFPCNISLSGLVVNVDAFRKVGLAPPEVDWDMDTFEKMGREYVRRANVNGKGPRKFFLGCIFSFPRTEQMFRGLGLTYFNETYTRPVYHQSKTIAAWKRLRKWMVEDHFFPALADRQSVNVEFGYGGSLLQLLASGRYAMGEGGRWSMIQMRKFKDPVNWNMVLYPHGGWPNALVGSRSVVLYKGGKNKKSAIAFLGFLRSDEYNMTIVKGSDGLPPNPRFMDTPEFLTPSGYSNEWPLHHANRLAANQYACSSEVSPFVHLANIKREESKAIEGFENGMFGAEELCQIIQSGMEKEMARFLRTHPEAAANYEKAKASQGRIDEAKALGKKIPLSLVDNPVLKKYYRDTGLGE